MKEGTDTSEWPRVLKEYSERNAGRRVSLEIDDPELGAQWAGVDFPLRGVAYDSRDHRIEIMLGEVGDPEAHLTHTIGAPSSVDLLSAGANGEVLRIAHGAGQTLLRIR